MEIGSDLVQFQTVSKPYYNGTNSVLIMMGWETLLKYITAIKQLST